MAHQQSTRLDLLSEVASFCNEPVAMQREFFKTIASRSLTDGDTAKLEAAALLHAGTHPIANWHIENGIGIIPVVGAIAKRSMFRWTYDDIAASFQQALDDAKVDAILFDVDSPGGAAAGMFDLIDLIFASRGIKPIHAIANESAYSAAYGIASAADVLWLPRTGGVGSVGMMAMHADFSKMNEDMGIKFTAIFAGDKKIDGNPEFPLSDSAEADVQTEIDRLHGMFVEMIARNRGMQAGAVRATEAGLFRGDNAIDIGFADRIGTFDDAVKFLSAETSQASGLSIADMSTSLGMTSTQFLDDLASAGFHSTQNAQDPAQLMEAESMAKEKEGSKKAEVSANDQKAEVKTEAKTDVVEVQASQESGAKVVDIKTARSAGHDEAAEEFKARAAQITDICALSGCPERAGEFISAGTIPADVSKALLDKRVEDSGPEIDGHAKPGSDSTETLIPVIDVDAVYSNWNRNSVA